MQRQKSTRAQIVSACCACAALVAVVIGYYSYKHVLDAERFKAAEDSIARLYELDLATERLFVQYPQVRDCLRKDNDGTKCGRLSADDKLRLLSACALVADECEYYLLIRDNIAGHRKNDEIVAAWDEYMKGLCEDSYGFRSYFVATKDIWTTGLRDSFDRYSRNRPFEGPK